MKSLRIELTGPDPFAVLGSLPDWLVPPGLPSELSVDDQPGEMPERWPADMRRCDMRRCDLSAMARRPGPAHRAGPTDIALAANSGAYNAGIAAGAALGALVLPLAGARGTFLAGGLLTAASCAVLLGGRLLGGHRHRL
ncbi:hypothetical protein ACGFI3_25475 [Nonomuraea wenchangensis]|uniref:hypothetical protein n=1 Tax=Nonomuraea wenchangensis TaxID=568860 RepID=UPI0037233115